MLAVVLSSNCEGMNPWGYLFSIFREKQEIEWI
jgi:hypothetical protein